MTRYKNMDELFERLLPSASHEHIEGARSRILENVRTGALEEPASPAVSPLNHGDYHILVVLSSGERHGYTIMTEVAAVTEGATKFGPGTLYTSIKRLLAAGLIKESRNRKDIAINDEPRRYYRLTGMGQNVLASQSEQFTRTRGYVRGPQIVRSI
jgi:DNA-binding PadR family transcriptional regulator